MTYDPAGSPLDPARGEDIVARAEGIAVAEPVARPAQVARPVTRRSTLPAPVRAAVVGGAGIATGLLIAAMLPKRSRSRVIVAPGHSRKRRKLRTKQTTSILVDLHLLDR
ncbi:MAG: hypothetical protein JHD16_03930 [Solirubrobacteraceae bacterium]|nr:hypothetical protein [Solirubrobacteraceae bacterium]